MLQVKNLSLSFPGEDNIFENVSFKVKENSITLLSGNSGVGKSSILMCITKVIPNVIEGNVSGEIFFKNENIEDKIIEDLAGDIAYMFQDPDSQLCAFTVEDEIAFGLENMNINPDDMDGIIDKVLKQVGIEYLRKRNLNELSGGEKQKVALASILALDPEFIIMDEPTANLDPASTKEIVDLTKSLRDDYGKTILIVDHKIKDIEEIVDEIIELEKLGSKKVNKDGFLKDYYERLSLPTREKKEINGDVILEAKDIYFSYDKDNQILKDIDFSLYGGEIAAIIGPNGAGKSTLTKLLLGLMKPDSGDIFVDDKSLFKMSPKDIGKNLGLVFQNPEHQFIEMTVENELGLSLKLRGDDPEEMPVKVNKYLEVFNLLEQREMNPFSLSQGQKRRLSTASMMINGQPILILDEPTYGQDRENLQELLKLLYDISDDGVSVLMITHDMELVSRSCDRYFYLEDGQIKSYGNVDSSFERNFERGEFIYEQS